MQTCNGRELALAVLPTALINCLQEKAAWSFVFHKKQF
jgi:hypothetical protein